MGLWWQEQERNQVRHLLDSVGVFHAFRYQRDAEAGKLRDVAAEYRFGPAFGALECEGRGAFLGGGAVR